jgi:hypothetical protein
MLSQSVSLGDSSMTAGCSTAAAASGGVVGVAGVLFVMAGIVPLARR